MDHFQGVTPEERWKNDMLNEQWKQTLILEQIAQLLNDKDKPTRRRKSGEKDEEGK